MSALLVVPILPAEVPPVLPLVPAVLPEPPVLPLVPVLPAEVPPVLPLVPAVLPEPPVLPLVPVLPAEVPPLLPLVPAVLSAPLRLCTLEPSAFIVLRGMTQTSPAADAGEEDLLGLVLLCEKAGRLKTKTAPKIPLIPVRLLSAKVLWHRFFDILFRSPINRDRFKYFRYF